MHIARSGKFMSASSVRFVTPLATVQALCSLAKRVLELYRLDEIGVPHQVLLSTQYSLPFMEILATPTKG